MCYPFDNTISVRGTLFEKAWEVHPGLILNFSMKMCTVNWLEANVKSHGIMAEISYLPDL